MPDDGAVMQPNEEDFKHILDFKERSDKMEALLSAALGVIALLRDDIIQINRNPIPRLALAALLHAAKEIGVQPQEVEL